MADIENDLNSVFNEVFQKFFDLMKLNGKHLKKFMVGKQERSINVFVDLERTLDGNFITFKKSKMNYDDDLDFRNSITTSDVLDNFLYKKIKYQQEVILVGIYYNIRHFWNMIIIRVILMQI